MSLGRSIPLIGLLVALGACDSGPAAPVETQSASDVLEKLSQDAARRGDHDLQMVLDQAVRAARLGVEPSVVAISVGGNSLRYRAFVGVMTFSIRPDLPAFEVRSFVAWTGEGEATKVFVVASGGPAASIMAPPGAGNWAGLTADPRTTAMAAYADGLTGPRWVGAAGSVRLVEVSTGGACPQPPQDVSCRIATYAVLLDGTLMPFGATERPITVPVSIQRTVVNAVTLQP